MMWKRGTLTGAVVTAAVLAAVACSPTVVCGCSEPVPSRIVEGTVRTEVGIALRSVVVTSVVRVDLPDFPPGYAPRDSTSTDSSGYYQLRIESATGERELTVDLTAIRLDVSPPDTLVTTLDMTLGRDDPPLDFDLVFPN